MKKTKDLFMLTNQVAVITGGAGLLGEKHAEAIVEMGGIPILADINERLANVKAKAISNKYHSEAIGLILDVTSEESIRKMLKAIISRFGKVDILINNAANDPKVIEKNASTQWTRLENFPEKTWDLDLAVGLKGSFLCSKVIGTEMAKRKKGVILNIASDLAVIAPDQRIYKKDKIPDEKQYVKPVTYSVVKTGLIGLTRYLATYWADKGIRVNAISPGGVYNHQPKEFMDKLVDLIPLRRMANVDEYKAAIIFLCSDASSYMTGANLIIDGGRTCW